MLNFISGLTVGSGLMLIWRLLRPRPDKNVMLLDRNSPLGQMWGEDWDWDTNSADDSTYGLSRNVIN